MKTAASIILFYGMLLISVVCFAWTLSRFSSGANSNDTISFNNEMMATISSSIKQSTAAAPSTSRSWEDDITWIGSVWIPSPRMTLYSTQEMQHILSYYDSILWLGDSISPFATLYNLLQHDNATGHLSRRKATDEAAAVNSTAACPPWMLLQSDNNITSAKSSPICHSILKNKLSFHNNPNNNIVETQQSGRVDRHRYHQRLDFVPTQCWFQLKQSLLDWYSSLQASSSSSSSSPSNILVIIALGCAEVSHNARRRRSCETPGTRQFPMGVWKRLDVVFQLLQDLMRASSSTTTTTITTNNAPTTITLVWRLGNYCQAHPDRDGHVQETDRRIRQGMNSLPSKLLASSSSSSSGVLWNVLQLDHGRAIQATVHALNAETRLEHNFVFLQLLANYLQQQQQQQDQGQHHEQKQ